MSNPESFIEEVTEEVRRDRLYTLYRRYGWIGILAVLVIVGGAAYNEWSKASAKAQAQALGDTLMAAVETEAPEARVAALKATEVPAEAQPLANLLIAAEQSVSTGEEAAALDGLRALAADSTAPLTYRHLATLKALLIEGATRPVAERRADVEPLAAPGAPFRPLAMEQLALLDAEEGKTDAAISRLQEILELPEATAGLRQRATQLIVALGGSIEPA